MAEAEAQAAAGREVLHAVLGDRVEGTLEKAGWPWRRSRFFRVTDSRLEYWSAAGAAGGPPRGGYAVGDLETVVTESPSLVFPYMYSW